MKDKIGCDEAKMSFIGLMKDKIGCDEAKMSFIGLMKDKIECDKGENVLHRAYEGQN